MAQSYLSDWNHSKTHFCTHLRHSSVMKMSADTTEEDPKHSTQLQLSLFQTGDVPKGLF